jgi:hypothetical protein
MQTIHLSEEQVRETVQRAREIAEQSPAPAASMTDLEAYVRAAEELGIPREAMLLALRERVQVPTEAFREGETVFAPSVDGHWYPAQIVTTGDHSVTVRFVSGGEHTCAPGDLRSLSLVPGRKVEIDAKGWGWWGARVQKYVEETGKVHVVHDDWSEHKETVPLHKVRLTSEIAKPQTAAEKQVKALSRASLARCSAVAGTIGIAVGYALAHLLPHLLPFLR